jgi:hypothetical protein
LPCQGRISEKPKDEIPERAASAFVGLVLMAAIGIIVGDVFPLPGAALIAVTIALAVCIVIVACRPMLLATYVIVGLGFFLLHNLKTSNTDGQQLADELGGRPRVVTATGSSSLSLRSLPAGLRRSC